MAGMDAEKEIREIKRRLDLAETRLSQMDGRFEFISGQLRDVQLYMHARFEDVDKRFDAVDKRFDGVDKRFDAVDRRLNTVETKIDALPRVIAELIAKRG